MLGQDALDAMTANDGQRAALLVLGGIPASEAASACGPLLRSADAATAVAHDRFAVLAPHLRETGGAADLAARMLHALPAFVRRRAAIGIAIAPDDSSDWEKLLDVAEMALRRAEQYVGGRFAFPDQERDERWRIGPLLAGAIAEALAENQFHLVFQPIARLADGEAISAEALIRWPRPGGETWSPAVFIPEAERRGLIEPITAWTMQAACRRLAAAPLGLTVGVNLSGAMLGFGAAEMVEGVLRTTGADPRRLIVEVTETAAFLDLPAALADVAAIRGLGCGVAIDDFGAGNASLGYVVKLPATRIKLDASLTRAFRADARAAAAIRATARLAADIGADVVAEGVGDAETAAGLADAGVALGQGRLFGGPEIALPA